MNGKFEDVDEYISATPKEFQGKFRELRRAIREAAPRAMEGISYGMPFYEYKGRLVYFALMKHHIGLYIPPPTIGEHRKELAQYETTKSAVRIPLDGAIPVALVKKLVRAKMKSNEEKSADTGF
jgi:uncharacterized protein YdhG (YjbR/CyaY superfamily)